MDGLILLLASVLSLSGTWDFKYVPLLKTDAEKVAWTTIDVPSSWELRGFGRFTYGEKLTEEYGIYRRTFETPADFKDGAHAFLVFEGVQYGATVSVNGQAAGTFRSSFNRNTLDAGALLKAPGEVNEITVKTGVKPKGAGFDTNDDWTLHGIFREVYLEVRPAVYLKDWTLTTVVTNGQAVVYVETLLGDAAEAASTGKVTVTLDGKSGKVCKDGRAKFGVKLDQLWCAEKPRLHELKMTVTNDKGEETETIVEKVGLREVRVDGTKLLVNGAPVFLTGVNHHDICPDHGRAITDEEEYADMKMIKEAGFNFVRLCHYPPRVSLLKACNELGLYVMDEVPFGFGAKNLTDPAFGEVLEERVRLTWARDRNEACVIIWSIGNENPVTPITINAAHLMAALDPTRPWTFPQTPKWFKDTVFDPQANGNPPILDWHYPSIHDVMEYVGRVDRPVISSEFAHAYGSETGRDLEKLMPNFLKKWPAWIGGAIWMFQDQGVKRWDRNGAIDTNGLAGTDGLVYSDRAPQTGWYEAIAVLNPKKYDAYLQKHMGYAKGAGASAPPVLKGGPEGAAPSALPCTTRMQRRMTIAKASALKEGNTNHRNKYLVKRTLLGEAPKPEVTFTKREDGKTLVTYTFSNDAAYDAAELGLTFEMPEGMTELRWSGMGPFECYPSRSRLDRDGVWHLTQKDLYFPGNRQDVKWAVVCDRAGRGWCIEPVAGTCSVAVEEKDGHVAFSFNHFVSEPCGKRDWPADMRHLSANELTGGRFLMYPCQLPPETVAPSHPETDNYDR